MKSDLRMTAAFGPDFCWNKFGQKTAFPCNKLADHETAQSTFALQNCALHYKDHKMTNAQPRNINLDQF